MPRLPRLPTPEPPEPRVDAIDLALLLRAAVYGPDPLEVPVVAERAGLSVRTVYRHLNPTATLDTADRLLIAIDRSLDDVKIIHGGKDVQD